MVKDKGQKDKQWLTKYYTENWRMSNTNTTKHWDEHACSVNITKNRDEHMCSVFLLGMNTCAPYSYLGWTHVLCIPTWDEHTCSVFSLGMTHVLRIPTWDEHMCSVFPLGMNTRAPYSHLGWIYVLRIPTWDEHMCSVFPLSKIQWGDIRNRQYRDTSSSGH
jgi:hypothetical protein